MLPAIDGDGNGFTVMVTNPDLEHPYVLVSTRVYAVVDAGVTDGLEEADVKPKGELDHI